MHVESIAIIAAFVPFGFFLAEFLALLNLSGSWRRIGLVALAAFGLSLCIECLQLLSRIGFFEVTDLVMNLVWGGVGAGMGVGEGGSVFQTLDFTRIKVTEDVDRFKPCCIVHHLSIGSSSKL